MITSAKTKRSKPVRAGDAVRAVERWGTFKSLAPRVPKPSLFVIDARVARLFPEVARVARANPHLLISAGESAKTVRSLEKILAAATFLPRESHLVVIGGGTLGDVGTVAAHLVKRGVHLIQVPTTLLAAVDSSVGGKGAVDLSAHGRHYKNAAGVFHYAQEIWICPEVFETLSAQQIREGLIESWKMIVCLDRALFEKGTSRPLSLLATVRAARRLKTEICARDPYETKGIREVLNFGHTFGHVVESLSNYKISHGDAVGLGIRCALDVGQQMGVTSRAVATAVETTLAARAQILGREKLAPVMRGRSTIDIFELLHADKKNRALGEVRMVLLEHPGKTKLTRVPASILTRAIARWKLV